jgi:fluoride exporter
MRQFYGWLAAHPHRTPLGMLATGATAGSFARFELMEWSARLLGRQLPYGTLAVNVLGSFILGFFLTLATGRLEISPNMRILVATGFCGSFTTFSAFSYEVVTLLQAGNYLAGILYPIASVAGGLLGVIGGVRLANTLSMRR